MLKKIITAMVSLLTIGGAFANPQKAGTTVKRDYSTMCKLCEEYCEEKGYIEHENIGVWMPVKSEKSEDYFFIRIYIDSYDYPTIVDTIYFCD